MIFQPFKEKKFKMSYKIYKINYENMKKKKNLIY